MYIDLTISNKGAYLWNPCAEPHKTNVMHIINDIYSSYISFRCLDNGGISIRMKTAT